MKNTQSFYNNWLVFVAVLLVSAGLAFFWLSFYGAKYVPEDFFMARIKGGDLSNEIVKLSGESLNNLKIIEEEGNAKNYGIALDLVQNEIERNEQARNEALALSEQLGIMAASINDIKPKEASKLAFQAVISESQIVQRLINYNSYIYQLLELLRSSFSLNNGDANKEEIRLLIVKMNEEISAINGLNQRYKELMTEFDTLTGS